MESANDLSLNLYVGGKDTPFATYVDNQTQTLLIMEILDVKACPWPEPGKKVKNDLDLLRVKGSYTTAFKLMELIRTCQETKFGHPASGMYLFRILPTRSPHS